MMFYRVQIPLLFCIVAIVSLPVGFARAADQNQRQSISSDSQRRFPPYPDRWVWNWANYTRWSSSTGVAGAAPQRGGIGRIYHSPDGDLKFELWNGQNTDGSCCDARKAFRIWDLFKDSSEDLTEHQAQEFWHAHHDEFVFPGVNASVRLSSETTLFPVDTTYNGRCFANFSRYYEVRDKGGNVLSSFYVIVVSWRAVTLGLDPNCDYAAGRSRLIEKVNSVPIEAVPLDDGTVLIWMESGPFVLRLDKNLRARSSVGGHVFLIDAKTLRGLFESLVPGDVVQRQAVVLQYLAAHNKESRAK